MGCTDSLNTGTTTTGNATLTVSNFNRLTVTAIPGATYYAWYRITAATSPTTTGFIGISATNTIDDTGLAGNDVSSNDEGATSGFGVDARVHFGPPEYTLDPTVIDESLPAQVLITANGLNGVLHGLGIETSNIFFGLTVNSSNTSGGVNAAVITGRDNGGTNQPITGVLTNPRVLLGATGSIVRGFVVAPTFQEASSVSIYKGVDIEAPNLFGGSTVTTAYGFAAPDFASKATTGYGFYTAGNSGSGQWAFYGAGTAPSHFEGAVEVGSLTYNGHPCSLVANVVTCP